MLLVSASLLLAGSSMEHSREDLAELSVQLGHILFFRVLLLELLVIRTDSCVLPIMQSYCSVNLLLDNNALYSLSMKNIGLPSESLPAT